MKKILYLMRHGQTVFNVRKKIQGYCDSPLTSLGIQQAKIAKQYFAMIPLDHAYCSSSERCSDTLEIITDKAYTRCKGLKEMNYGMFEGESEELNPKTPKECETFFIPYGGESSNTVKERMVETLTNIMEEADHYQVLAVSHSGACYNFLQAWQDPNPELQKGFTNCCIFKYEYENKKFTLLEVIRHQV